MEQAWEDMRGHGCEKVLWYESRALDAARIHLTDTGRIAINVGGVVIVKPIAEWHKLATAQPPFYNEELSIAVRAVARLSERVRVLKAFARSVAEWHPEAGDTYVTRSTIDVTRENAIAALAASVGAPASEVVPKEQPAAPEAPCGMTAVWTPADVARLDAALQEVGLGLADGDVIKLDTDGCVVIWNEERRRAENTGVTPRYFGYMTPDELARCAASKPA
jgi:hypothetical protein